jgi:O-acetylhomoserine (thiol)-lyase
MNQTLLERFQSLVGEYRPAPLVTDVAFPLPGGLEGASAAFAGEIEADIYARPHNPTVAAFAEVINRLDGGVGALAFASGQAAVRNVLGLLCAQDTEIIVSSHLFGGTAAIGSGIFARYGVTFKYADATDAASFAAQVTDRTRAFFFESAANPGGDIADFKGLRELATKHNIPVIVDNTTSPLLCRPKDHGANIVVYSATKYINGRGNAAAGIVVDTGQFPWKDDPRYPYITASPAGAGSFVDRFGERAFFKALQSHLTIDGSILAPEQAERIHRNFYSLPERLVAHIANTKRVAAFLQTHTAVESVRYAGLETDSNHERAKLYFPFGVAGTMLLTLKGGQAAAEHVINNIGEHFLHAVNIGDAGKNLISHPATTTHRQLSDAHKEKIGIKPGSLRLCISADKGEEALAGLTNALEYAPR